MPTVKDRRPRRSGDKSQRQGLDLLGCMERLCWSWRTRTRWRSSRPRSRKGQLLTWKTWTACDDESLKLDNNKWSQRLIQTQQTTTEAKAATTAEHWRAAQATAASATVVLAGTKESAGMAADNITAEMPAATTAEHWRAVPTTTASAVVVVTGTKAQQGWQLAAVKSGAQGERRMEHLVLEAATTNVVVVGDVTKETSRSNRRTGRASNNRKTTIGTSVVEISKERDWSQTTS